MRAEHPLTNGKWRKVTLSEVATIERSSLQPEKIKAGTTYVGLEHIESSGVFLDPKPVDAGALASSKFQFTERHVLYGKLRPYLAKIACPDFTGICSTDILPILPGEKIDRRFLFHFLRQPSMVDYAASHAVGVNLPRLSPSALAKFEIPLPPLPEQRRIAEVLDRAEALRAKRRAALAELDSLTQSIFLDMFGDPVRNPKKMQKKSLGELIKLKSGEFLPATKMAESGAFPVLGGNGLSGYHDRYMFDRPQIIIGRVGVYCGCIHVSAPMSWVTDNALYVSDRSKDIEFDYLVYALKYANLNRYASQSGQPLVSGPRIYPVEILAPTIDLQREFARRVQAVEKLKAGQRASLAELDALFASLQHRAFRGEL